MFVILQAHFGIFELSIFLHADEMGRQTQKLLFNAVPC